MRNRKVLNYPVGTSMESSFPFACCLVLLKTIYLLLLVLFNTLDNSATHSYQQACLPSCSDFLYLRTDKKMTLNVLIHFFLNLLVHSVNFFSHFSGFNINDHLRHMTIFPLHGSTGS